MSHKIRAILIEVAERQVREIEIETGPQPMYDALDCRIVECVPLDRRNDLWVDEEGLFAEPQPEKYLIWGYPNLFAGNGLILAHDGKGETINTTLTADHVRAIVRWAGAVHVEPQRPQFVPWEEMGDGIDFTPL